MHRPFYFYDSQAFQRYVTSLLQGVQLRPLGVSPLVVLTSIESSLFQRVEDSYSVKPTVPDMLIKFFLHLLGKLLVFLVQSFFHRGSLIQLLLNLLFYFLESIFEVLQDRIFG